MDFFKKKFIYIHKHQNGNPLTKSNPLKIVDETLNFAESIIQANGFEQNTNMLDDQKEIAEALEIAQTQKEEKKTQLNNILIDAEDEWGVVNKKKKIKQNKEKEKPINTIVERIPEVLLKEEIKPLKKDDSIDIVEKLKMKNQINYPKEEKPQNTIENLLNNNKFEVVAKKKKKKNDGKGKPPGKIKKLL